MLQRSLLPRAISTQNPLMLRKKSSSMLFLPFSSRNQRKSILELFVLEKYRKHSTSRMSIMDLFNRTPTPIIAQRESTFSSYPYYDYRLTLVRNSSSNYLESRYTVDSVKSYRACFGRKELIDRSPKRCEVNVPYALTYGRVPYFIGTARYGTLKISGIGLGPFAPSN